MSWPTTVAESDGRSLVLSPTVTGDDDLAAQVDQALSSRRHVHHSRRRSSLSLNLFRPSHLRKTDSRTSSKQVDLTRDRSDNPTDEGDSDEEQGVEADSEDKKRRRSRRLRRAEVNVPPPIQLLVRKAEPVRPIDVDVPGLPLPRAQHVHFPSSDDRPEGSSSQRPLTASLDGEPGHSQDMDWAMQMSHSKTGDSSSGPMVNLLAPRPEERHQAKAEVRKLKKGHSREYVWDGMSTSQPVAVVETLNANPCDLLQSSLRIREGAFSD
jgi:hypothetical protein